MAEKKKRFDSINDDLTDIMIQYPNISYNYIERFAPIYYPIAMIEVDLNERSFEDFEAIQLIVLKLYALGLNTPDKIASAAGLNSNYVRRMLKVLAGYGHIADGKVTELGKESIAKGKKIELKRTASRFQVNALNGQFIKVKDVISDKQLDTIDETRFSVAHMTALSGASTQYLVEQIQNERYKDYVLNKRGVLNINADSINNIRFVGLEYALSYVLKLKGCQPVILTKRYDSTQKEFSERIKWKPFSISDSNLKKYGIGTTAPQSTTLEQEYIDKTIRLIDEAAKERITPDKYEEMLTNAYPFNLSHMRKNVQTHRAIYEANSLSIHRYNGKLLHMLKDFGERNVSIFSNDKLFGNMLYVVPGAEVSVVANQFVDKINDLGWRRVRNYLDDQFESDKDYENLLSDISSSLNQLVR